ncbi:MAG TPA: tetratricopeptide repeat protein, partial [Pyrinomonadaceae bacterium]|nr:tetratricopeptide repeat protein [Pyrinomonadaceae bacterium]
KFDEQYSDIFSVQDSISAKLAGALTLQITSSDRAHAARQATQNTAAYEAYLMGLYFWNSGGDGLAKAIPYFQRAVELDSNFTLAIAYLADCYYFNAAINYGIVPVEESRQKAHAYVAQALAIDESVAEAHMALAGLKTLEEDYAGAKTEFERTLTLNPNIALAHNRYGVFLFHMSDLDGAVRELRRGQELDPVSRLTNVALANMLLFARKYDESIMYSRRAVEIDPNFSRGWLILGEGYLLQGKYAEAIKQFEELFRRQPAQSMSGLGKIDLAIAYAAAGRTAEARKVLRELQQAKEQPRPYCYATAYGALGDTDQAFAELSKEAPTHFRLTTLKYDPFLDPLRSDPRLNALLQRTPHGYQDY